MTGGTGAIDSSASPSSISSASAAAWSTAAAMPSVSCWVANDDESGDGETTICDVWHNDK